MHIRLISAITLLALGVCAPLRAQELRGEVRDAEGRPLAGASVYWAGTTVGTSADGGGTFRLHRVKGRELLVASFLGYVNDTLRVDAAAQQAAFGLRAEGVELEGVVVEAAQSGNFVKRDGIVKGEMISFAGLCKMACCNLAESFENSASVTVGYSDAISGARQIKMLGLAGTYTQILDENRPVMRGLSAPYGLSYTPGMWLNSIQVSKGVASVTAGHDAITGQINLEHRKPTDEERLFVNLYLDDELRPEANISTAFPGSRDGKLSSVLLLHGSVGVNAFLSRSLGEKNYDAANRAAENGVFLAVLSTLVFTVAGLTLAHPFIAVQTDIPDIVSSGTAYMRICGGLSFGLFLEIMFERLLQATGRTFYTMLTQGTGAIINIIMDPVLIFGLGPFPRMEVAGAAAATVLGQIVAAVLAVLFNLTCNHDIHPTLRGFRPNGPVIRNIYSVGAPSIILNSIGSVMTFGMNQILFAFSSTAVAVFNVYFKLQ